MKMRLKKINWKQVVKAIFLQWLRHYKLLFFVSFLVVAGIGGYQWRQNLYGYSWTPEERKTYLDKTIKETVFHEQQFLSVLEALERTQSDHLTPRTPAKELFVRAREEK